MREKQPDARTDQLTTSPVMRAWAEERAASEPHERRHAIVTFLGAAAIVAGLAAAVSLGKPWLAPAARTVRAAFRNLL